MTTEEKILRRKIVEEAESWIGTPYQFGAKEKGKGVDCAEFGIMPWKNVGLIPIGVQVLRQHKDWIHGKSVDKDAFKNFILKFGYEVPFDDRLPADMITFYYRGKDNIAIESHVAILVCDDHIVHAQSGRKVKKHHLSTHKNVCSVYRYKGFDRGR
jgi:cell wall-associated NlpC family hydrolase